MNLSQVIHKPVLTEKSVRMEEKGQYTFFVHQDATKVDVKQAIHMLFGAKVKSVNINTRKAKYRLGKKRNPLQKRSENRKAIVTLVKGEKLTLTKKAKA
ncbi:MAG: 50S ribosomal protein L23 [Patescibacteria group bacterium]